MKIKNKYDEYPLIMKSILKGILFIIFTKGHFFSSCLLLQIPCSI